MSVVLRPAAGDDLDAIGALHASSRDGAYAGLVSAAALAAVPGPALAAWWRERWTWEADTHRLTVAVAAGAVVGFSYVGPAEEPDCGELYAIHVDPARQGTGVGRALLAAAAGELAAYGPRAVLWVLAGNVRARRFYERAGWAPDGARRRTPIGPELVDQVRYATRLGGSTGPS